MSSILSVLRLNHHNSKQYYRQKLYDNLTLILKTIEVHPHCSYLKSYILSALECFIFCKRMFSNHQYINIVNKNKLRNILHFVSKRDCYEVGDLNILCELYNYI